VSPAAHQNTGGDYVKPYDPKAHEKSNNVETARTKPCIPLYPLANRNNLWMFYNLATKADVHMMQWRKLPVNQAIINIMNEEATGYDVKVDGMDAEDTVHNMCEHEPMETHTVVPNEQVEMTTEEVGMDVNEDPPELGYFNDNDTDSESGDSEFEECEIEDEIKEIYELLQVNSDDSGMANKKHQVPLRLSICTTASVKAHDEAYEWSLMNLSVGSANCSFGAVASEACKAELVQLFREMKALNQ
jgi:hypothetical protein